MVSNLGNPASRSFAACSALLVVGAVAGLALAAEARSPLASARRLPRLYGLAA